MVYLVVKIDNGGLCNVWVCGEWNGENCREHGKESFDLLFAVAILLSFRFDALLTAGSNQEEPHFDTMLVRKQTKEQINTKSYCIPEYAIIETM